MTVLGKCDAPRCGSPAEVTSRMGGRYCAGHAYLAQAPPAITRARDERDAALAELKQTYPDGRSESPDA